MLGGEVRGGTQRIIGVLHRVIVFVVGLQATQDVVGLLDGRLHDVDLLETTGQRAVSLEALAVLLVGRRPDTADRALGERGLQDIRGIHRAAGGRPGADDSVDLVDKEDRVLFFLERVDHSLESLLELPAKLRARQQATHIQGIDPGVLEHVGDLALRNLTGQPLGERRLPDACFSDEYGVVLAASAQNLDGPLDLVVAPDQRVDVTLFGSRDQIRAVRFQGILQRIVLVVAEGTFPLAARGVRFVVLIAIFVSAAVLDLGDAVGDVADHVEPGHILFLQEEQRVRVGLGEGRHEDVSTIDFLFARRANMHDRALHDPLKGDRLDGVDLHRFGQRLDLIVEIRLEVVL